LEGKPRILGGVTRLLETLPKEGKVMNYTHVLYHGGGCPDGFGAAFAAWKKLGNTVKYIGLHPSDPIPQLPRDARVVMLDMAYHKEKFLVLRDSVADVKVFDHHVTNSREIGDLPGVHLDMNHSGAYLAWAHFHGEPVPDFIRHIEDRDLWLFKLPRTREVAAGLGSYEQRFDLWEQLMTMGMEKLALDGGVILRYQAQMVERICGNAVMKEIDGHIVPVVNTACLQSEVGDRLCQLHPTVPFSAYYFDKEGMRCWGLRSPGRFDVSVIARKRGGGGHPGAAGFTEVDKG
jgi:oligoribonuclease NrnB/cAMP/cGMP phosphodiesterase (DHH superfamily)